MLKPLSRLLLLTSTLLISPQLLAGGFYFGAKTGRMVIDNTNTLIRDVATGVDSQPTNGSLLVGYEIMGIIVGDLAVEGELSRTMSPGQGGNEDVKVDTNAIYAAVRTAGPFYFKAKTGFVDQSISRGGVSDSHTGSSSGAGIGIGIGVAQVELEYTVFKNDTSYISLGLQLDL